MLATTPEVEGATFAHRQNTTCSTLSLHTRCLCSRFSTVIRQARPCSYTETWAYILPNSLTDAILLIGVVVLVNFYLAWSCGASSGEPRSVFLLHLCPLSLATSYCRTDNGSLLYPVQTPHHHALLDLKQQHKRRKITSLTSKFPSPVIEATRPLQYLPKLD